jgi:hypothetical protein
VAREAEGAAADAGRYRRAGMEGMRRIARALALAGLALLATGLPAASAHLHVQPVGLAESRVAAAAPAPLGDVARPCAECLGLAAVKPGPRPCAPLERTPVAGVPLAPAAPAPVPAARPLPSRAPRAPPRPA